MSLTTRCPSCRTMFKVVPDQLKISEGWVRCGKCEEIFDAAAHLQEPVEEEDADAPTASPDPSFGGALASAMAVESGGRTKRASSRAVAEDAPRKKPLGEVVPADLAEADTMLLPDKPSPNAHAPRVAEAKSRPAPLAATPAAELSFMRDAAGTASRWHRPLVRAGLMVLALLLVLGLALQILIQERDRIAAVEPGLKPLVLGVCQWFDCQLAPLRQIESVVIDSSAFSKIKGDLYRLNLTLKNNAPVDLAMPAVELALTDTLDRALMRRVFQPEELGVKSGIIPAVSETQTTLVLTIKSGGNGERVAGYRLLAFYP